MAEHNLKPCLHPRANHQHGHYLAYQKDGCRCKPCILAGRRYTKLIAHRTHTSSHSYVDAHPARAHVQQLLKTLTISQIEQRSGINRTTIRVLIGDFPGRPASKRTKKKTEHALLAIKPELIGTETSGLCHPVGTRRRLQALMTLGWTGRYLTGRLGASTRTITTIVYDTNDTPIQVGTRIKVTELYDELSMTIPPPSRARTRIRNIAKTNGWLPPLAWDDDKIDNPKPQNSHTVQRKNSEPFDEIAIEAVLSQKITHDQAARFSTAERTETTRQWLATGRTHNALNRATGWRSQRYTTKTTTRTTA